MFRFGAPPGVVEIVEQGAGATLIGGWVRLPEAEAREGRARLRLYRDRHDPLDIALGRLRPNPSVPTRGSDPPAWSFMLLRPSLPAWTEGRCELLSEGGTAALQPARLRPAPYLARGHIEFAGPRECWGWLVPGPDQAPALRFDDGPAFPLTLTQHRTDLPFDDGSALPCFGFHLRFTDDAQRHAAHLAARAILLAGETEVHARAFERQGEFDAAPARTSIPVLRPAPAIPAIPDPSEAAGTAGPIRLTIECMQPLGEEGVLLGGWVIRPAGPPPQFGLPADSQTTPLPGFLYPRGDLDVVTGPGEVAEGVLLCLPRGAQVLEVVLQGATRRFAMPPPGQGPAAEEHLAGIEAGARADLLWHLASAMPGSPLLGTPRRPDGAFATWLDGLPLVAPAPTPRHGEAPAGLCSPAGEVLLAAAGAEDLRALALTAEGPRGLEDAALAAGPGGLVLHAHLPVTPARAILVEWRSGGARRWQRLVPHTEAAPAFLRSMAGLLGQAAGLDAVASSGWLRRVLAARARRFGARLTHGAADAAEGAPLVVLCGLGDAFAPLLLRAVAPALEAGAGAVMLLGEPADTDAAAEALLPKLTIPLRTGRHLHEALALDTSRPLVPMDLAMLAEAALRAEPAEALALLCREPLPPAARGVIEALARGAGNLDGTETLQRLALLRDGSDRLIAPLEHLLPMPGHAGAVASAHLAGLWRQALARLLPPVAHA